MSSIVREEGRSVPYRWEVANVLGRGCVGLSHAFGVWICEKRLAINNKGQQPDSEVMVRTSDLGLRLLRAVMCEDGGPERLL